MCGLRKYVFNSRQTTSKLRNIRYKMIIKPLGRSLTRFSIEASDMENHSPKKVHSLRQRPTSNLFYKPHFETRRVHIPFSRNLVLYRHHFGFRGKRLPRLWLDASQALCPSRLASLTTAPSLSSSRVLEDRCRMDGQAMKVCRLS